MHDPGTDRPKGAHEAIARELLDAEHAVAFTGAGVSTPSGIPDFRSEGGIWDEYDPEDFHYSRFRADPGDFWRERVAMHDAVYGGDVTPNPAHEALATLESRGHLDAVVTQNIDGLHAAAGSESVVELHGSAERVVCEDCRTRTPAAPVRERVDTGEVPPTCAACGGVLKPDVVLFGEQLPAGALGTARTYAESADVFLAIGSSLTVEPAASLPRIAARTDATLVVINLEETPVSDRAAFDCRADVVEAVPGILSAVEALEADG